jgi:3-deoxy-manno-octulosonate cytidylyltransferase (CMP-KDO synthetase)
MSKAITVNRDSKFTDRRVVICIPARFGSTRFPGKVLAELAGKPIIQWVFEKAQSSIADEVIVAADNATVMNTVKEFGGKCIMTKTNHPSGTDRIWEAVQKVDGDIIINVQGDEPLIDVSTINKLIEALKNNQKIEMATVVVKADRNVIGKDPNAVKVVLNRKNFAIYFSRSEVPYIREKVENHPIYHHVGIYAFRRDILEHFVSLPISNLEKCEKLEQLRALDNGIRILAVVSDKNNGIGIDTPEDLKKAEEIFKQLY